MMKKEKKEKKHRTTAYHESFVTDSFDRNSRFGQRMSFESDLVSKQAHRNINTTDRLTSRNGCGSHLELALDLKHIAALSNFPTRNLRELKYGEGTAPWQYS